MVADNALPWLQDTSEESVWTSWAPTYRDVIVLDGENHFVTAYNLTLNQLSDVDNRAALKAILIEGEIQTMDSGGD